MALIALLDARDGQKRGAVGRLGRGVPLRGGCGGKIDAAGDDRDLSMLGACRTHEAGRVAAHRYRLARVCRGERGQPRAGADLFGVEVLHERHTEGPAYGCRGRTGDDVHAERQIGAQAQRLAHGGGVQQRQPPGAGSSATPTRCTTVDLAPSNCAAPGVEREHPRLEALDTRGQALAHQLDAPRRRRVVRREDQQSRSSCHRVRGSGRPIAPARAVARAARCSRDRRGDARARARVRPRGRSTPRRR